ncbi:MAG: DUF1194 domain-containing protein [Acetobacteraceae bacterium]
MRALFIAFALLLAGFPLARAAQPVDVELVLVTDVSRSIVSSEFALEKQGYASAIESPEVLNAIKQGPIGAIAVSYVEFSGPHQITTVVGWQRIDNLATARKFAAAMLAEPRSSVGRTAIGSAIAAAVGDLAESGLTATRRMIDVCGDGNDNAGIAMHVARAEAGKAGVTINGLAIIHDNPPPWLVPHVDPPGGLVKYYHDHVIAGPGSFVMQVHDYHDFGTAMTRKLVLEIASG